MLNTDIYSLKYTQEVPHSLLTEMSQSALLILVQLKAYQARKKIIILINTGHWGNQHGIFGLEQLICVLCKLYNMFKDPNAKATYHNIFNKLALTWTKSTC